MDEHDHNNNNNQIEEEIPLNNKLYLNNYNNIPAQKSQYDTQETEQEQKKEDERERKRESKRPLPLKRLKFGSNKNIS